VRQDPFSNRIDKLKRFLAFTQRLLVVCSRLFHILEEARIDILRSIFPHRYLQLFIQSSDFLKFRRSFLVGLVALFNLEPRNFEH